MASRTHPVVVKSALKVIELAYNEGINAQISEGYRSNARQNQLYAQGRTRSGNVVTNARAGQSWHNHRVAVDFFLTNNDGSKAVWNVNADWRRVVAIAKGLGFEAGLDWTSFVDAPHLQMTGGLSLSDLQAGKRPNLSMKDGSSVPKPSKPTTSKPSSTKWRNRNFKWTGQVLKQGDKGRAVKDMQKLLAKKYFYPNKGAKNNGIDSYMGSNTVDALKRYQSINGLVVDGVGGKASYASLTGKKSKPAKKKPTRSKLPSGILRQGSRGKDVKKLQKALNKVHFNVGKADSIFGARTKDGVRRFQKIHDPYNVDGIYGKRTRSRLQKLI